MEARMGLFVPGVKAGISCTAMRGWTYTNVLFGLRLNQLSWPDRQEEHMFYGSLTTGCYSHSMSLISMNNQKCESPTYA